MLHGGKLERGRGYEAPFARERVENAGWPGAEVSRPVVDAMQVQAGLVGGVREYVLLEIVVAELRAKGKNEVGVLSQVDTPRLRRSSPSSIVSPRAVLSFSLPALNADETSTRRHERGSPEHLERAPVSVSK